MKKRLLGRRKWKPYTKYDSHGDAKMKNGKSGDV
jgi:hypothetical protein